MSVPVGLCICILYTSFTCKHVYLEEYGQALNNLRVFSYKELRYVSALSIYVVDF